MFSPELKYVLQIKTCLIVLAKDHTESSSFVCFILSHGSKQNMISTYDGQMDLNNIIQMADVPDLKGKPKIFVIQVLFVI